MKKRTFLFYPDILFVSIYPEQVVAQVRPGRGEGVRERRKRLFTASFIIICMKLQTFLTASVLRPDLFLLVKKETI